MRFTNRISSKGSKLLRLIVRIGSQVLESISLDKTISKEEDGASLGSLIGTKDFSPQDMIEKRDALVSVMEAIQNSWIEFEPETRSLLSDALTADILGTMFDSGALDSVSEEISSEYENMDVFESDNYSLAT